MPRKQKEYPRYLVQVVKDKKGNYIKAVYSTVEPKTVETPFGGEIERETPFGDVRGS